MDIFKSFATDEKSETEGRWFPLSKTTKVLVARTGNPAYIRLARKKLEENKVDLESQGDEGSDLAEMVMTEVMAKTILLGWEGLEYKGKKVDYSVEMAKTLLGIKDFRKKIASLSDNFEAFKLKEEEALGND